MAMLRLLVSCSDDHPDELFVMELRKSLGEPDEVIFVDDGVAYTRHTIITSCLVAIIGDSINTDGCSVLSILSCRENDRLYRYHVFTVDPAVANINGMIVDAWMDGYTRCPQGR
jgi:hypothetical protein